MTFKNFNNFNQRVGISTIIATFVFVLLIGFLSFYVNNARTQVTNILQIDEHLHQLLFLNKKVDVVLEKDMKFYNYDNIEKLFLEIKNRKEQINLLSSQNKLENKRLKKQINEIRKKLEVKLNLLEEFKSTNAVLNNSYRYIMTLASSLNEVNYSEEYHKILHNVLMKVLSLSNDNSININDEISKIKQLKKIKSSDDDNNKYFLLHAELVFEYYKKFNIIRANNDSLNLERKIEHLIFDYDSYNTKLINSISFVIVLLIIIIIIFLLLFLQFGYKLEVKVKEESEKIVSQEKQLFQQSRSAAMGEMMGAIIHQWKQPLNTLSVANSGLKLSMKMGIDITKEELLKTADIVETQIYNMNTTMEDFRNFFKPQKLREYNVNDSVNDVINLIGKIYESHNVSIKCDLGHNIITSGYPNELNQVIINILNNARDIIAETNCDVKDVFIKSLKENNNAVITITDCAGGVPESIIDKIFDPYVTTKSDDKGTGIGLDMSKTIIEKVKGNLSVENVVTVVDGKDYKGAQFKIELNE